MHANERGFTLIELLAAAVLIVVLLVLSLFLLRPDDYTLARDNAKRRTDVSEIVQAINRYMDDTGQPLPDVPEQTTAISSEEDRYDLCKHLSPKYLYDMPLDPLAGIKADKDGNLAEKSCGSGSVYASGYSIQKNKDGRILVSAPLAETVTGEVIEILVPKK